MNRAPSAKWFAIHGSSPNQLQQSEKPDEQLKNSNCNKEDINETASQNSEQEKLKKSINWWLELQDEFAPKIHSDQC